MLLAKNFLSHKAYLSAKTKGVSKFLFNEIDFIPPEATDDQFVNCTKYRVESTWYTWKVNNEILEKFKQKCPQLFDFNGYDLTLAIQKAMYWANFKTGFLWYTLTEEFSDQTNPIIEGMHSVNKLSIKYRYYRTRLSSGKNQSAFQIKKSLQESKLIHIKNNFQLGLYQNILNEIYDHKDYVVFVDHKVDKHLLSLFKFKKFVRISEDYDTYKFPKISFKDFSDSDWYVLNICLTHWLEINECYRVALNLLDAQPGVVLLNEAENGIYGALVSEVMTKNDVQVYNTMNGIKAGESQDAYINFNKWFVWDDQMKQLLIDKCYLPQDKLIVCGHLIEDVVKNYKYQNSLKVDLDQLNGKKVISVFSVRGKRFVKLETMNYLYDLIKEDNSYFLMIRPHPSEKPEDYILPDSNTKNYLFVEYDSYNLNDTLHDQLAISDLSIVFGSTVSLDSKWMNVPCITYEKREQSLIYCTDEKWIYHVKSIDDLNTKMLHILSHSKPLYQAEHSSVSGFIINELNKALDDLHHS